MNTIIILGFSNWKFWFKKLDLDRGQKDPNHVGQVDFNMPSVIGVVFLTNKVKTI
jgi:hypothetical protein